MHAARCKTRGDQGPFGDGIQWPLCALLALSSDSPHATSNTTTTVPIAYRTTTSARQPQPGGTAGCHSYLAPTKDTYCVPSPSPAYTFPHNTRECKFERALSSGPPALASLSLSLPRQTFFVQATVAISSLLPPQRRNRMLSRFPLVQAILWEKIFLGPRTCYLCRAKNSNPDPRQHKLLEGHTGKRIGKGFTYQPGDPIRRRLRSHRASLLA
jgi:hypothetical protein